MEEHKRKAASAELTDDTSKVNDILGANDSTSGESPIGASSSKRPPPESSENIRVRSQVIFSFWAIVLLFGLPTWWWTTSIYRARLPLQEMHEWADGKACRPSFPLKILIEAPSLHENEAQHLLRTTQHALDDLNEFSAHHLRLQLSTTAATSNASQISKPRAQFAKDGEDDIALTVRLLPQDSRASPEAILRPHSTTMEIYCSSGQLPTTSSGSSALASFIATELQDLFAEEQAIIAQILSGQFSSQAAQSQQSSTAREHRNGKRKTLPPKLATRISSRMVRSLKYAPTYHITLSLFTPASVPASWDIEAALEECFTPLLDSLSQISNFTVDTQVQLHATFSSSVQQPEYDATLGSWTLREEDLSGFINAAEWPLSPSIGAGPTVNFVLYVPDQSNAPLAVRGTQATSWLIPQWGGVAILNPPTSSSANISFPTILSKKAVQPALMTFSHQLLSFLGAPESPVSLPLQLKTLTRVQAASLLQSASSTMGSLARLTVALPSIAIPETVSDAVEKTLFRLRGTCDTLRNGEFKSALAHARIAEAEAEKGFFEKSMVGQVYFPDEHKVAVYLPLLGPVAVPLIMSLLKELKRIWIISNVRGRQL
ncbi:MAG: hypothetical protein Q9191_005337 [Dirinaria sp. TL-2023a]